MRSKYKPCEHGKEYEQSMGICAVGEVFFCNYCGHVWTDTDKRSEYEHQLQEKLMRQGIYISMSENDPDLLIDERTGIRITGTKPQIDRIRQGQKMAKINSVANQFFGIIPKDITPVEEAVWLGYRVKEC